MSINIKSINSFFFYFISKKFFYYFFYLQNYIKIFIFLLVMENMSTIWVDKYRPKSFDDIIGQEYFVKRVRSFVESRSLPHLLFAGSPGTGKTTTALVVARELYGENGLRGNFLELNASDDRGIDVIRNRIKEFAKLKSLTDIPYKIIILDEADSLTKEAQQALRRTMEKYSATCRFILACNEISKLIDPIQSRCVIFKFKPLSEKALLDLVKRIEKAEKINPLTEEIIEQLDNKNTLFGNICQEKQKLISIIIQKNKQYNLEKITCNEIDTLLNQYKYIGDKHNFQVFKKK